MIVPADFGNQRSLHTIILMVVGGMVNFAGPMIGTPILTLAYELLNAYPYYREILFGVVLLVVMMFLRVGLVTLPERLASLVGRMRALRSKKEVSPIERP